MTASTSAPESAKTRSLRHNLNFQLLWTGQVVSTVGSRVSSLAYPLLVLAITRSPLMAGIAGAAQSLPLLLFSLPAGAIADRYDRKFLLLVSDGIRMLALGSIAIALALNIITIAQIIIVAFIEGAFLALFKVTQSAAIPHIVTKQQLSTALAQNQAREEGAELVGRPLGGYLYGLTSIFPFAADAVSYAISFCTLLFVKRPLQDPASRPRGNIISTIAEGMRWISKQKFLRAITWMSGVTNGIFNALPLIMIVRAEQLGARPWLTGAMFTFFGLGAIIGSLIAPMIQRIVPASVVIVGTQWLWAAVIGSLVFCTNVVVLGAVVGATMLATPAWNVVTAVYRYGLTPENMQAQMQGVIRVVSNGALSLGSFIAGALITGVGAGHSFLVLAGVTALVALAGTCSPSVRRPPDLESQPSSAG